MTFIGKCRKIWGAMCQLINCSKEASKYTVCVFLLRVESTFPNLTLLTDWPSCQVVLVWKTPRDQQLAQTPVTSINTKWNLLVALLAADTIALTTTFLGTGYLEIPTYLIEVESATTSWCQHYHWQRLLDYSRWKPAYHQPDPSLPFIHTFTPFLDCQEINMCD